MTILVAYVARPEGQAALDKAIEIATRRNERLVVINAGPGGGHDDTVVNGYEVERVEERLAKLEIATQFKQFVRGNSTIAAADRDIAIRRRPAGRRRRLRAWSKA